MLSIRWITRFAIAFCCALALAAPLQAQTILRVDGDSGLDFPNEPDPGDSWDNAYKFLQDALDRAEFLTANDPGLTVQLWVAATDADNPYRPDQCATCGPGGMPGSSGDRTATFNLINDVAIYGGFLGTDHPVAPETQLNQRDPEANETVLSGKVTPPDPPVECGPGAGPCHEPNPTPGCEEVNCCDAVCFINPACCSLAWDGLCVQIAAALCPGNAFHVVTADGVDETARIDGFSVTKGSAIGGGGGEGGGMLIVSGGGPDYDGDPIVVRCRFIDNVAELGGGMMVFGDISPIEPTIVNCTFVNNLATGTGASGSGGGLYSEFALTTLTNCKFVENSAENEGGAIYLIKGGPVKIFNCTIADNTADGQQSPGGGIMIKGAPAASAEIYNSILWGNSPDQIADETGITKVHFSDVEGDWTGDGDCNINADPMFILGRGVYQLMSGSPCIDAAWNGALAIAQDPADLDDDGITDQPLPLDLDLNDRRIDHQDTDDCPQLFCECGAQPVVDMGAYEFVFVPGCPWDLNGSGDVGILDLLALLAAWGPNPGDPADFDGDGIVGILDLLALLANWGPCVAGGVAGDSLEEVLTEAGLSIDDWDLLQDILHSGNNEAIDNALCWFGYYINGCDGGTRQACMDHDPFTDCVGDLNGDCCVDRLDAAILLNQLGPCPAGPGACLGDLNGDCVVDKSDHRDLLSHFGACPTTQYCPSVPPGCGTTTTTQLQGAVTQMGFSGVADYQGHISTTSEGEAFVCACVLQVLLEVQP